MATKIAQPSARQRLLDAALKRFARDGAMAATLEEIRADAGVSVGALYHHFADKAALAGTLYVETLRGYQQGFLEVLDANPEAEAGIRAAVRHTLDWCSKHPAEARLLFGGRGDADTAALAEINRDFFSRAARWYWGHAHYGVLRPLEFPLVSSLWLGPTLDHLRHWLHSGEKTVSDETAEILAEAAWRALRKDQT
ncbi:MAG TPA: TetR family transcriptional regulator [Solirubrobacteraceae bacterium]